jgi:hypothetical protein
MGGGMHARKLVTKVTDAFTDADPACRVSA